MSRRLLTRRPSPQLAAGELTHLGRVLVADAHAAERLRSASPAPTTSALISGRP